MSLPGRADCDGRRDPDAAVARGPYRLYAEVVPGPGVPVVLMHDPGLPIDLVMQSRWQAARALSR
jgi:hypothetical protein